MRSLGMRFRGIFRSRDPGKLDSWIDDAVNSGLVAIERFARVLHPDLDAVYNAIELSWCNGQAEGQINPLKTIKRAMVWQNWPGAAQGTHAATRPKSPRAGQLSLQFLR